MFHSSVYQLSFARWQHTREHNNSLTVKLCLYCTLLISTVFSSFCNDINYRSNFTVLYLLHKNFSIFKTF